MFAPVSDSVEMIRFVTFGTCHDTTNGSPLSSRYPTCLCIPHSLQWRCSSVAQDWQVGRSRQHWDVVSIMDWAGCSPFLDLPLPPLPPLLLSGRALPPLQLMISSRSAVYVASRLVLRSMCCFKPWCAFQFRA